MSALDITALIVAWIALLIIVGRDRIRDVLNDFRAAPDRRQHVRELHRATRVTAEDPLEASWRLPAREPRRIA